MKTQTIEVELQRQYETKISGLLYILQSAYKNRHLPAANVYYIYKRAIDQALLDLDCIYDRMHQRQP